MTEKRSPAKKDVDDVTLPPDDDPVKEDLVEYFGADGKDEGQKFAQNADGSWGEEQNAAG
jgi:hypothetical protein